VSPGPNQRLRIVKASASRDLPLRATTPLWSLRIDDEFEARIAVVDFPGEADERDEDPR
jgi:hypothetical protein